MYVHGYCASKLRAFTSPHVHYEVEKWKLLVWIHEVRDAMLYKVECDSEECVKQTEEGKVNAKSLHFMFLYLHLLTYFLSFLLSTCCLQLCLFFCLSLGV